MNPRIVRFFMLEKDINVDREEVDIFAMENRREPYLSRNPADAPVHRRDCPVAA
jgi:glutathione S-transferase